MSYQTDPAALKPCPFCGGDSEIVDAVEAGEQAKVVCCRKCLASSRVIFALMDDVTFDLVSAWNARATDPAALVKALDIDLIEQAISDVLSEGGTYRDAAEYVANTLAKMEKKQ